MFKPGLRQVIVGEAIAKRYPDAKIGKKLKFGKGEWDVVGVFSVGESASNSEVWLDLGQFNGDFERGGDSSSLLVAVNDPAQIGDLKKRIEGDQTLGATVISEADYYESLTNNFSSRFLQIMGYAVAVIMAVGSAFAATNTMYAAVSRRTREIGTLRAAGLWAGVDSNVVHVGINFSVAFGRSCGGLTVASYQWDGGGRGQFSDIQ